MDTTQSVEDEGTESYLNYDEEPAKIAVCSLNVQEKSAPENGNDVNYIEKSPEKETQDFEDVQSCASDISNSKQSLSPTDDRQYGSRHLQDARDLFYVQELQEVDLGELEHFCAALNQGEQICHSSNRTSVAQTDELSSTMQSSSCDFPASSAQTMYLTKHCSDGINTQTDTPTAVSVSELSPIVQTYKPSESSSEVENNASSKKQENSYLGSAKTNSKCSSPNHLTQVLTIAEDRLSLLSFESDCASSNDPPEAETLESSRCTTSDEDEEDDAWVENILSESLRRPKEDLQAQNDALQRTVSYLSQKISTLEKQLTSNELEFQEALARARVQSKAQIDKLKVQVESATKDKEAMVVRYAQSEREVINSKKSKEITDKKIRDFLHERDSLLGKIKVLHADRVRACSSLDSKMAELAHCQREVDKLKEELMNRDIKIKWAQNKLKEESDMHKETLGKLDQTVQRLRETREESEQVRRDCQDMIRRYQEAEEIKSVALDQELKVKLSELEVQKQERSDQEEVHLAMRRELETFKKRDRTSLEENHSLTVKIQALERERLEYEQTLSKLKETLNKLRQEAVDLNEKLAEKENLELQLEREREKVSASQREVERLRAAHQDLQNDLEACHTKEGELLEFTQKLTTKTVHLQSEHSLLEVKAQNLNEEVTHLSRQCAELESSKKELIQELSEEHRLRQEETQILARKLAEKTKSVEVLTIKLEEAENEAKVLKRRHITSIKELSRELAHTKKRLEQQTSSGGDANATVFNNHHAAGSGTPGESLSLQGSSRTSSSGSLVELNSSGHNMNAPGGLNQEPKPQTQQIVNSSHPPPIVTFSNRKPSKLKPDNFTSKHRTKIRENITPSGSQPPIQVSNQSGSSIPDLDQQILIERIVRLQKILARRNEKVDFLEEHVQQLLADIKKKSKIIQNYILREEAGALAPSTMDQNKAEVLRRGGIMASVYGSHVTDSSMTLDLSLEINRKLQAVLEDTILKNITLKENINTLGHEIARISREQKKFVT